MEVALTKWISELMVIYWKALPIFAMALLWLFFTGFRFILKTKEQRLLRETLLCFFCFGLGLAFLCFGTYGLVDPANGLARPGAAPVGEAALLRFEWMGYSSLAVALVAGMLLELSFRWKKWPN